VDEHDWNPASFAALAGELDLSDTDALRHGADAS
jgi:hypothetical protein